MVFQYLCAASKDSFGRDLGPTIPRRPQTSLQLPVLLDHVHDQYDTFAFLF